MLKTWNNFKTVDTLNIEVEDSEIRHVLPRHFNRRLPVFSLDDLADTDQLQKMSLNHQPKGGVIVYYHDTSHLIFLLTRSW